MKLAHAPDIHKRIVVILSRVTFAHIDATRIFCMRSEGATARARARIWSFPRIWQIALQKEPHYVIEVLAHHFDHLSEEDKTRVLIHELMHIPKTFSGALAPHKGRFHKINRRTVEQYFKQYQNAKG